jgi:voltage-gated potassium channel
MSGITKVLSSSALWRWLGLKRHNWPGRFTILLVANLALLVSQPLFSTHTLAQILTTATMALVLLAALYAFSSMRTYFVVALILIVPALGTRLALVFTPSTTLEMIGALSSCMFLAVTVVALVTRLFNVRTVTVETISAAICAYLLMGIAWAYAFAALELRTPGAFSTTLFQKGVGYGAPLLASLHTFLYYSFVCLTTTGFGDITPMSEGARSLSVMEAVFGQLYVAILIARLVSLEVAQSMREQDKGVED